MPEPQKLELRKLGLKRLQPQKLEQLLTALRLPGLKMLEPQKLELRILALRKLELRKLETVRPMPERRMLLR